MHNTMLKTHKWLIEEDNWIKEHIVGHPRKETWQGFKEHFNVEVGFRAFEMRCSKLHLHNGLVGGQFPKGNIPFNKGKKQVDYMTPEMIERTAKTRFKKGDVPHNHREMFHESKRIKHGVEDYTLIKVAEKTFIPKQRYVWEQAHNEKLTKNDVVIFADGDINNFDPDNLIKITKEELLILNREGLYVKGNANATLVGTDIAKIIAKLREVQ